MIFDLPVNILLTLLLLVLMGLVYFSINKLIHKNDDKVNKTVFLLMYLILFLVIISSIVFGFYIWGADVKGYLLNLWSDISSGVVDKLGAVISTIIIILVAGFIIKIFRAMVRRSERIVKSTNERRKHTILKITASIVNYSIKLIALLAVLSAWGVNVLPALAGLGILGLVIGLGAQDLIKDFIAGFFIVFEKHFDVGDIVEIDGFKGEVVDIGLKTTRVRNWKSDIKIFNNSSVQKTINYSISHSLAVVEFGIAYHSDLDKTIEILTQELPKLRELLPQLIEDPICSGVVSLADSSINLRVVAKTLTEQHYGAERVIRKEIKKILDNNGIEIPFPQVVVHQPKH